MLNYFPSIIIALLFFIVIILIFRLSRRKEDLLLHQKIDSASGTILTQFSQLNEKIAILDRESQDLLNLTKSFHDILKPTKTRGILGENILESLIKDILPQDSVLPQYTFRSGKKVDFIIRLPQGMVPIDAKFSLETFKSYLEALPQEKERQKKSFIDSVKRRIDETSEYIFPDEGTTDFSLMYVPSEAVYYSIITETSLLDYGQKKRVFIVGPNTIYVYLKTILIGFSALKIEKRAKEIYGSLKRLDKDVEDIISECSILGVHLKNTSTKYDDVRKKMENLNIKLKDLSKENA